MLFKKQGRKGTIKMEEHTAKIEEHTACRFVLLLQVPEA